MSDWTRSETISPPNNIIIKYKNVTASGAAQEKEVTLLSTTRSASESTYQTFKYTDRDGKDQQSDLQVSKVDVTFTTIASVNQSYISWRLTKDLGLPPGDAQSRTVTTSEYRETTEGMVLSRETTEAFVCMAQFAGGLQIEDYGSFRPTGDEMVLSHRTIREINKITGANGREMTQTKTSRWMARGETSEGKTEFTTLFRAFKSLVASDGGIVRRLVDIYTPLIFEGTEVQVEVGRLPPPEKPSDQDQTRNEVTDGRDPDPTNVTPEQKYGNSSGWYSYVPTDQNRSWQSYVNDTTGNGQPDWMDYVPLSSEAYDTDSNNDGNPDWSSFVPQVAGEYDRDSDKDGVPDWAESVPTGWEAFDKDSNDDGTPDWAPYVPASWQAFNKDSDNDGVPDWAPYVDGDWQDFNKDTNNDGVPDWADSVPTAWQDFDQDSNDDGEPDWAPYVPDDWTAYNVISDGSTDPAWSSHVLTGSALDVDTNGDGVPNWASFVPVGHDFSTADSDYTRGGLQI